MASLSKKLKQLICPQGRSSHLQGSTSMMKQRAQRMRRSSMAYVRAELCVRIDLPFSPPHGWFHASKLSHS